MNFKSIDQTVGEDLEQQPKGLFGLGVSKEEREAARYRRAEEVARQREAELSKRYEQQWNAWERKARAKEKEDQKRAEVKARREEEIRIAREKAIARRDEERRRRAAMQGIDGCIGEELGFMGTPVVPFMSGMGLPAAAAYATDPRLSTPIQPPSLSASADPFEADQAKVDALRAELNAAIATGNADKIDKVADKLKVEAATSNTSSYSVNSVLDQIQRGIELAEKAKNLIKINKGTKKPVVPKVIYVEPEKKTNWLLWGGVAVAALAFGGVFYAKKKGKI